MVFALCLVFSTSCQLLLACSRILVLGAGCMYLLLVLTGFHSFPGSIETSKSNCCFSYGRPVVKIYPIRMRYFPTFGIFSMFFKCLCSKGVCFTGAKLS